MRYDKETLKNKTEWEGMPDALDWFGPEEVPEDLQEAWRAAKQAWAELSDWLGIIYDYLDVE